MDFPDYAAKYSSDALKAKKDFPTELRATLDDIENGLLEDPNRFPDRVIQVSRDGNSCVYSHPDPVIQVTYEIDPKQKIIYFFLYSAPSMSVKKSLFISYSHEDEEWFVKVRKFLSVLEQEGLLKFWDDTHLEAGKPWNEQILEELESAEAGVLLVSQEFLTSKYINETELPKLLEGVKAKGKSIYWIHVSPSTVFKTHPEITKFESLHKNPKKSLSELSDVEQKKALVTISNRLSETVH